MRKPARSFDLDGGFVPILGNTFNILTATGEVSSEFDTVDVSGMSAGLTFHLNYLPNAVHLQIVATPFHSADAADLSIWQSAYDLNQLGDSDGADFLAWQQQFGSVSAVASAKAVPGPGTLFMTALALAAAACRAPRRLYPGPTLTDLTE